ncbi:restriction endonuclease subunit S [Vibrio vulnificus]
MSKAAMSGKYAAYPEYKDSGVEWLGEIPAHWKTCRLKHLASIKNGQDYKAVQSEVGYPVMGSGGQFAFATEFMYDKPSVLLGRKGTIDKPLYINEPFWTVDTMYYTEMQPETDAKYLYYLATTIQFARYSTNTALPSMTQEHLGNYIFAVPVEVSDRTQIANFLDHETAKIDTLIEKQQQLIKLLKEKRQAVISHAVTKGLNPQAPMKDSGVEWLGEVPEHWVVSRFKYCTDRVIVGIAEAATHAYSETGTVLIRSTNIKEDGLTTHNLLYLKTKFADQNESKYIRGGDIVTVRTGYPGISAVVPDSLDRSHCFTNLISTPKIKFVGGYLTEYLNSDMGKAYFDLNAWGSAQKNISVPILQEFPIAHPDENEQQEILRFVEQQRSKFDNLLNASQKSIEFMKERRTALISAAVIGKIDVRNWQAPTSQNQSA